MRMWLDDIRPVPDDFDVWAVTADDAIFYIKEGYVTHISFDHDLGEKGGTGYTVACFIEACAEDIPDFPHITYDIHSANPAGRARIESAMQSAERFWNK